MILYHLLYISTATDYQSDTQLAALLEEAVTANLQYQVTGMLLYCEGDFMQLIEGKKSDIIQLYDNICRDERNFENEVLVEEPIAERHFVDWSMGFKQFSKEEYQIHNQGFDLKDFASSIKKTGHMSTAIHFLHSFYQWNYLAREEETAIDMAD